MDVRYSEMLLPRGVHGSDRSIHDERHGRDGRRRPDTPKVTIGDSTRPGEDITHHAMVFFGGDADNEPFRWLASTKISLDDEGFVRIDGKHVTVETTFDKDLTGEKEEVPGKLEGTCP